MLTFLFIIGGLGALAGFIYQNWAITIGVVLVALVYAAVQYFFATRQALTLTGAREVDAQTAPRLYRIVENLAISQGLPMPKVYVVQDDAPNAFATGRNPENAIVAATTGLLDMMTDAELEGVMAHEMSHVKNYDIRVNMIVFGLVAAIGMLGDLLMRAAFFSSGNRNSSLNAPLLILGLVGMLLAPLAATMVQLAVSREREYLADASGAMMTRYPEGLASALHKLETHGQPMRKQNSSMAHMWISNPLSAGAVKKLFSTHPPTADRIQRLLSIQDRF